MATSGGVSCEIHACVGASDSTFERPEMVPGKSRMGSVVHRTRQEVAGLA